jgi:hypothetical protein
VPLEPDLPRPVDIWLSYHPGSNKYPPDSAHDRLDYCGS